MEIIIYMILGYWATGRTIYRKRILIGTAEGIFMKRVMMGTILGFILIPLAILSCLLDMLKK